MPTTIKTILVPGTDAAQTLDDIRRAWKSGGDLPFLIGSAEDLNNLEALCDPPPDGGARILAAARDIDIDTWLKAHESGGGKSWPKVPVPAPRTLHTLYDLASRTRKPEIHIGLVAVEAPEELFAKLGYGGWNACPPAHVHVALQRYWWVRHLAAPVAISGDVVEYHVVRPPNRRKDALALACEHFAYCPDIVEQGIGTVNKLGSRLLDSKFWYFWWD